MTGIPDKLFKWTMLTLTVLWLVTGQSCSQMPRVLILADPYGMEAFPEMRTSASETSAALGVQMDWMELPPQAEVPVFQGLTSPDVYYDVIYLPDLYEPEIRETLSSSALDVVVWGYGNPADPGPSLGWSRTEALAGLTDSVVKEEELLHRSKPILFAAVFGPEGTSASEESLLRSRWPSGLGADRLWIYRTANSLDRGLALQAASVLLSQNVDMAYVDAGRMTPEIFRSLAGAGVRLALPDWRVQGLSHPKVRFSLDRDWKIFWYEAFSRIKTRSWDRISVQFSLSEIFSKETTLLKSIHIR